MSILVKGMEMPESCYYCPFADGVWQKNKRCLINGKEMPRDGRNVQQNHLTCPLIEIPPHGRLIDEEAVLDHFVRMSNDEWNQNTGTSWANAYAEAADDICDIPTVIPADKGGET